MSQIGIDSFCNLTNGPIFNDGFAQAEWDIAMKINTDAIFYIVDQLLQHDKINDSPVLKSVFMIFQLLSRTGLSNTDKRGGDALRLTTEDGPLLICQVGFMWDPNATAEEPQQFQKDIDGFRCAMLLQLTRT